MSVGPENGQTCSSKMFGHMKKCTFCRSAVLCIRILEVADQDAWLKNPNKSWKNHVVLLFHFSFAKRFDDSLQDTAAPRMHMTSSSVACPHWVRSSTAKISWESETKMLDGKGAVQDAHSFVPFELLMQWSHQRLATWEVTSGFTVGFFEDAIWSSMQLALLCFLVARLQRGKLHAKTPHWL